MKTSNLAQKTMKAARLAAVDAMERGGHRQGYDVRAFRDALKRVMRADSAAFETSHHAE